METGLIPYSGIERGESRQAYRKVRNGDFDAAIRAQFALGADTQEIADAINRPESQVYNRITLLRKSGEWS